jgi:hypothetical protein
MPYVVETFSMKADDNNERMLVKTSSKPCSSYGEAIAVFDLTLRSSVDHRVELQSLNSGRTGYYCIKREAPSKWRQANEVKLTPDAMYRNGQQTLC